MNGLWGSYLGNIIMTMMIAAVPVIELRGAIPIGVANGLDVQTALLVSIIGNMLPVPIIILFVRKVFAWMRHASERLNGIVSKLEQKAYNKKEVIDKYEWWGLVILVAIPLPGTGAWTGALVAAMLDMQLRRALPAIFTGVIIAGLIVTSITYGATVFLF
ncbi:MAG: small multi-drug export protein [Firmicutes bacterium]|nr:small multi-drug export protein [Bacillota bacterium]